MGKYQIHFKPATIEKVTLELEAEELISIGHAMKNHYPSIWANLEKYPNANIDSSTATIYRALKAADLLGELEDWL